MASDTFFLFAMEVVCPGRASVNGMRVGHVVGNIQILKEIIHSWVSKLLI